MTKVKDPRGSLKAARRELSLRELARVTTGPLHPKPVATTEPLPYPDPTVEEVRAAARTLARLSRSVYGRANFDWTDSVQNTKVTMMMLLAAERMEKAASRRTAKAIVEDASWRRSHGGRKRKSGKRGKNGPVKTIRPASPQERTPLSDALRDTLKDRSERSRLMRSRFDDVS